MKISNNVVPNINAITKQVNTNPMFMGLSVEFCKIGVHMNKYMLITAWKIDSIKPIDNTSRFFSSENASPKDVRILIRVFSIGLFSPQRENIENIPKKENAMEIQSGAKIPHRL